MTPELAAPAHRRTVRQALSALGVDHLALQIHDASFPSVAEEDVGYGSPCSRGGRSFLELCAALGFDAIQLGPQGATSDINPSPYDATLFSRNPLAVALLPLAEDEEWGRLLPRERVAALVAGRPLGRDRVHYRYAFGRIPGALDEAWARFARARRAAGGPAVAALSNRLAAFTREHGDWLERDALYEPLCEEHRAPSWRLWRRGDAPHADQALWDPAPGEETAMRRRRAEILARHAAAVERYAFAQLVAHEQHSQLRGLAAGLGLRLLADLQAGFSHRDAWSYRALFLRGYRMGAPPSRTNPEGQPWGFPVLDPGRFRGADGRAGPALRFLAERLRKLHGEYDGVRIDHPHGWVCPWVYRSHGADPFAAVRAGARLFASPDLPDHPQLARFSRVAPEQLDRRRERHADGWVRSLSPAQVERYSELFDRLVRPRAADDGSFLTLCEVLSTWPYPLRRVMERHGLGRFRVVQKADPADPADPYRTENAEPPDWIMLGNHDTPPIWALAEEWVSSGAARERAADVARRVAPGERAREAIARQLAADPGALVHGMVADMLASRARHAMVFFPDLLGLRERYNVPGTVSDANWSLRVPPDFERSYLEKLAANRSLNLPRALAMALRSPSRAGAASREALAALDAAADRLAFAGRALATPRR